MQEKFLIFKLISRFATPKGESGHIVAGGSVAQLVEQ